MRVSKLLINLKPLYSFAGVFCYLKGERRFKAGHIDIKLTREGSSIRLKSKLESALFSNQTFREVLAVITANFDVVKSHFEPRAVDLIPEEDLNNVSLKIVVNYFYMYNMWRSRYKKDANRDLSFRNEDLDGTITVDSIWLYFEDKYPENYKNICAAMLGVSLERFDEIETARMQFANK